MADNEIFDLIEKSHGQIIFRVAAYAEKLIETYTWFRGRDALPGGWGSADDFALEALTRLLEKPDQFDIMRSKITVDNIVALLNRNIVRNLVRGARNKDENRKTTDFDGDLEEVLPFDQFLLDDKIDVRTIKKYFEKALSEEEELYEIFIGIYEDGLRRADICDQLEISTEEYDRRMKRLDNRIKKAAEIFKKGLD